MSLDDLATMSSRNCSTSAYIYLLIRLKQEISYLLVCHVRSNLILLQAIVLRVLLGQVALQYRQGGVHSLSTINLDLLFFSFNSLIYSSICRTSSLLNSWTFLSASASLVL